MQIVYKKMKDEIILVVAFLIVVFRSGLEWLTWRRFSSWSLVDGINLGSLFFFSFLKKYSYFVGVSLRFLNGILSAELELLRQVPRGILTGLKRNSKRPGRLNLCLVQLVSLLGARMDLSFGFILQHSLHVYLIRSG